MDRKHKNNEKNSYKYLILFQNYTQFYNYIYIKSARVYLHRNIRNIHFQLLFINNAISYRYFLFLLTSYFFD